MIKIVPTVLLIVIGVMAIIFLIITFYPEVEPDELWAYISINETLQNPILRFELEPSNYVFSIVALDSQNFYNATKYRIEMNEQCYPVSCGSTYCFECDLNNDALVRGNEK